MIEHGVAHRYLHFTPHLASHTAGILLGGAILFFALLYALLFFGALISVLGSPQTGGLKLVWCVIVFAFPFLGSLLWFVVGRPNARAYRREY
ncbi:MAG TPA: PLD nuclease N-terminal domain-containing protein [Pseudonocardiaceae bacterium]|jgi:hypothetical protein|nr:PLD nuclease N-terminal domain-containing protein [Pseudonocardiaceae bacterium]